MHNSNRLLVTVSGPDHPGITSKLMNLIVEQEGNIVDMGQAVTHGLLSLSILIKTKEKEPEDSHLLKDMLFETNKMGLNLAYQIIEPKKTIVDPGEKFMLNCVSTNNLPAEFVLEISKLMADRHINILRIDNVHPLNFKSLEMATTIPEDLSLDEFKKELLSISNKYSVDVAFLKDNVFRRSKRLIVFDMDSTLIQAEVIDEMAKKVGASDFVKEITEKAMNGELDFNESITKRVEKLKGLTIDQMQEVLEELPFTPGVVDFVQTVKNLGYKVAIISGGFSYFAQALKEKLGIDYAFANELEMVNGKLTGKLSGTIINAEQKATILKLIAQQEKISLEQVVAIGDGANDLPMLAEAGLGIAFHAKEIVKREAQQHMSHGPMTSILYFLGIPGPQV